MSTVTIGEIRSGPNVISSKHFIAVKDEKGWTVGPIWKAIGNLFAFEVITCQSAELSIEVMVRLEEILKSTKPTEVAK